ncbi:hypothetical protein BIW11_12913 [Tropilaelaps mercedesae]|uniref:PH domain-containing protein n=1 Tax=Tropilaelaps mercedesae TaxID=418985 RepID=A0A1V9X4A4_9ACAR|nr:hypothetical protein BIW11_12913 [Tropilaelaps mercedesae]
MADVTKKAGGYVQVKLIAADRTSQTWSGWSRRWVDLLVVKQDADVSKKKTFTEAWMEVRKSQGSGKPIKMWTIDAKNTLIYRCTSKSKKHPFGIRFKGKDLLYISGKSESESQEWIKLIRETLWPTDKGVQLELTAGRLFEASIIDNNYSVACELFGRYGHLAVRENKLIFVDHNGTNVIQEWYLHTIRKLDAFRASQVDTGRLLSIHLGETSSTGCGILYLFCPRAVLLLETIQTTIKETFSNLEDERKAQQATLMSLSALHDISLEETEYSAALKTITISDEIMKAKNNLIVGRVRGAPRPSNTAPVEEATNKNEPFIWCDNDLYEDVERANYVPELDDARKNKKQQRSQSLVFMTRPRANSCTLELDLPDLKKLKDQLLQRRGSLPQQAITEKLTGRMSLPNDAQLEASQLRQGLHSYRQVLNLSAERDANEVYQVVNENAESTKCVLHETSEVIHTIAKPTLGALDENDEIVDESDSATCMTRQPSTAIKGTPEPSSEPAELASPTTSNAPSNEAHVRITGETPTDAVQDSRLDLQENNTESSAQMSAIGESETTKSKSVRYDQNPVEATPTISHRMDADGNPPVILTGNVNNLNNNNDGEQGRHDSSREDKINFDHPAVMSPTPPPKPKRAMQGSKKSNGESTVNLGELL